MSSRKQFRVVGICGPSLPPRILELLVRGRPAAWPPLPLSKGSRQSAEVAGISGSHCGPPASLPHLQAVLCVLFFFFFRLFFVEKSRVKENKNGNTWKHKLLLRKGRWKPSLCSHGRCPSLPHRGWGEVVPVSTSMGLLFLLAWAHQGPTLSAKKAISPLTF